MQLTNDGSSNFSPHLDYFPSNGWVAFTRAAVPTGTSYQRIYQRSPLGQVTTVSPAGVDAYILAAWGGQVMYVSKGYLYRVQG